MLLESHLLSPPHLPSLPSTPPPLPAPGLRHSALRHYLLAPIPLSLALRPPSLANSRPSHHALPVALLPVRNGHWSTCPCTRRGLQNRWLTAQRKHNCLGKTNISKLVLQKRAMVNIQPESNVIFFFFLVRVGAGKVWRVHLFMVRARKH